MRQLFLTKNDCYKRNASIADSRYAKFQKEGPKGIMMHSTGANNPNLCRYVGPNDGILGENIYGNHWNNPGLDVCVHAFIGLTDNGQVECYQTLPWNYRGWHCGWDGNNTHIGIEICEDNKQSESYFRKTKDKAIEVVAELCMKYKLDPMKPGVLIDHYEGSNLGIASAHEDVNYWWRRFGYSMTNFRKDVKNYIVKEEEKLTKEIEKLVKTEVAMAISCIKIPVPNVSKAAADAVRDELSIWGTKDKHSDWADDSINWAIENKLINGHENGNYGFKKPITRQEIITIMHRFYLMIEKMVGGNK